MRIAPGTGQWKINDRTLDEYFPNKVHQQLINEPFVTLGAEEQFDVIARISGGGVTGQAGRAAPGHRQGADPGRPGEPPGAQAGRLPDQGRAGQGAQEGRPEEGPQGAAVLQALVSRRRRVANCVERHGAGYMGRLFGTDGVRGVAGSELTAGLAMSLAAAATDVLAGTGAFARARDAHRRPVAVVGRDPRASGEFLEAAVVAGLAASGVDVLRLGVIPTPAVAYLTAELAPTSA